MSSRRFGIAYNLSRPEAVLPLSGTPGRGQGRGASDAPLQVAFDPRRFSRLHREPDLRAVRLRPLWGFERMLTPSAPCPSPPPSPRSSGERECAPLMPRVLDQLARDT